MVVYHQRISIENVAVTHQTLVLFTLIIYHVIRDSYRYKAVLQNDIKYRYMLNYDFFSNLKIRSKDICCNCVSLCKSKPFKRVKAAVFVKKISKEPMKWRNFRSRPRWP